MSDARARSHYPPLAGVRHLDGYRGHGYIDSVYYQCVMLGARPPSTLSAQNVVAVESVPRHSGSEGSHDPAN
jgi:hypothetical protein